MNITDSDFRRASVLLLHFANDSQAGVDAILDEAELAGRLRQVCWCVPSIVMGRSAGWSSDVAKEMLAALATLFSVREVQ